MKSTASKLLSRYKRTAVLLFSIILVIYLFKLASHLLTGARLILNTMDQSPPRTEVLGNLGGLSVRIPAAFVNNIRYDGSPSDWGTERLGYKQPLDSATARIRSFGYRVRFPDMSPASLSSGDSPNAPPTSSETFWLSVGISSGEDYSGDGFLDRWATGTVGTPNLIYPVANYEPLEEAVFGLEVYAPLGVDPSTGIPYRQHRDAHDVFLKHDQNGKVLAAIRCSNRDVIAPPCSHFASLEPDAGVTITILYSRKLLAQWSAIQDAVVTHLLSFDTARQGQ